MNRQECWDYLGYKDFYGYGRVKQDKKYLKVHRLFYIYFIGKIPIGKVLDHLCKNKSCVNPNHLEITSIGENIRRGIQKEICLRGHSMQEAYISPKGKRVCNFCLKIRRGKKLQKQLHSTAEAA